MGSRQRRLKMRLATSLSCALLGMDTNTSYLCYPVGASDLDTHWTQSQRSYEPGERQGKRRKLTLYMKK